MARFCGQCGRPKRSANEREPDEFHLSLIKGFPAQCLIEFTHVVDGERVEASTEDLTRTKENQAAWIHASRL